MFCFNRSRFPVFIQLKMTPYDLPSVELENGAGFCIVNFSLLPSFFQGGKKIWDFQKPEAQEGNELWSKNGNGG